MTARRSVEITCHGCGREERVGQSTITEARSELAADGWHVARVLGGRPTSSTRQPDWCGPCWQLAREKATRIAEQLRRPGAELLER